MANRGRYLAISTTTTTTRATTSSCLRYRENNNGATPPTKLSNKTRTSARLTTAERAPTQHDDVGLEKEKSPGRAATREPGTTGRRRRRPLLALPALPTPSASVAGPSAPTPAEVPEDDMVGVEVSWATSHVHIQMRHNLLQTQQRQGVSALWSPSKIAVRSVDHGLLLNPLVCRRVPSSTLPMRPRQSPSHIPVASPTRHAELNSADASHRPELAARQSFTSHVLVALCQGSSTCQDVTLLRSQLVVHSTVAMPSRPCNFSWLMNDTSSKTLMPPKQRTKARPALPNFPQIDCIIHDTDCGVERVWTDLGAYRRWLIEGKARNDKWAELVDRERRERHDRGQYTDDEESESDSQSGEEVEDGPDAPASGPGPAVEDPWLTFENVHQAMMSLGPMFGMHVPEDLSLPVVFDMDKWDKMKVAKQPKLVEQGRPQYFHPSPPSPLPKGPGIV
ncbi:hypothetical protein D9611_011837 [Ephemerocybe angulata]|uniref:Uncharacterized protein n=1 Tax=Ephemerocybe angulata TaxID=980116 RepID=A0A8H5FCF3_9AGAR|nr:hypothetical protein D9611_011837 [Tulosesus angulatus]